MFTQDPQPQAQTGEWILSQEEYRQRELSSKVIQYHKNSCEEVTQRLRENAGEPEKRSDHGKEATETRIKVQARRQESEQREACSKSTNNQKNLQATIDLNSLPPPPWDIQEKKKPRVKDKTLHSTHGNRVITNPRSKSQTKKVKNVMKNNETQDVAKSDRCQQIH